LSYRGRCQPLLSGMIYVITLDDARVRQTIFW